MHETHHLLENILDIGFVHHRAVTQLWAEIAHNLTESVVLPMDIEWYATYLQESFNDVEVQYGKQLSDNDVSLGILLYFSVQF